MRRSQLQAMIIFALNERLLKIKLHISKLQYCILSIVLSIPSIAFSGGFQVNLQGQKQTGMGHCGTALSLGASSAFFNPGAFGFSESSEITFGLSFVMSKIRYVAAYPSTYTTETISKPGTPFTFYSDFKIPKFKRWTFGLGVYTPFGSSIQYQDHWIGQFIVREMSLRTIFTQPTIGFRINDKIGLGAGYVYGTGDFLMRRALPVQFQNKQYAEALLTGDGGGHGLNTGIFIKLLPKFSVGMSYRSPLKISLSDGLAEFSVPESLSDSFPNTTFSTSFILPQVFSFGISCNMTEKFSATADFNFIGWNVYDSLLFDFTENTENLTDLSSARRYENSVIFRLGCQYQLSEALKMRAGLYYDFTPVGDGYLTPETPDNNKLGITTGWTWQAATHWQLNTSFVYLYALARTDTNIETSFGGTWQSNAFIPGFGLEYIF